MWACGQRHQPGLGRNPRGRAKSLVTKQLRMTGNSAKASSCTVGNTDLILRAFLRSDPRVRCPTPHPHAPRPGAKAPHSPWLPAQPGASGSSSRTAGPGHATGGEEARTSHLADGHRGGNLRQAEQDGKKQDQTDRGSHRRAGKVGAGSYGMLPREGGECVHVFLALLGITALQRNGKQ